MSEYSVMDLYEIYRLNKQITKPACPSCGGSGHMGIYGSPCISCDGKGYKTKMSSFDVGRLEDKLNDE